jgi:Uma2 family endonuclease
MSTTTDDAIATETPGRAPYRLSLAQFDAMHRAGILTRADRVELWEGVLVQKMIKHTPHIITAALLGDFLYRVVPRPEFFLSPEPTIVIPVDGRESTPEPDWIVAVGAVWSYPRDRRIETRDILVVIEIGDSSLPEDRTSQKVLYARAGIPVYWIINIPDRRIEVYTAPTGPIAAPDYLHAEVYLEDQEIPLILAGRELSQTLVRQLLPPAESQG